VRRSSKRLSHGARLALLFWAVATIVILALARWSEPDADQKARAECESQGGRMVLADGGRVCRMTKTMLGRL
jgi:uncharacterized heparinase superfamily protein